MRKKIRFNRSFLSHVLSATLALLMALSVSLAAISHAIRNDIRKSCFENLQYTLEQSVYSLCVAVEKDRLHLSTVAELIGAQADPTGDETVAVLRAFNGGVTLTDVGVLYPDDTALLSDGSRVSASGVMSFAHESAEGVHISGRSALLSDPDKVILRHFIPINQNGKTVALLYGIMDLSRMMELVQVDMYEGNAELYLADRGTGEIIMDTYHSDLGTLDMLRQRKIVSGISADDVISDICKGRKGSFVSVSQSTGENFYAYYMPVKLNNWQAMLTVSEPIAMQQAELPSLLLVILAAIYAASFVVYGLTIFNIYRRYMDMFANTPAGICVLSADEKLHIMQANKEFYRIMKLADKSKKGIPDNLMDMLRDDDKLKIEKVYKCLISSEDQRGTAELQVTDPQGQLHWVLATIYYDKKGADISVNILDITDRKRMEQKLLLLDQEYRIALQMTKRYVVFYDINQRTATLLPGAADMLELTENAENFPQMLLEGDLLDEESRESFNDFFWSIWNGERSGGAYLRIRKSVQDEYRWYRVEFFAVYDDDHRTTCAILSFEDAEEKHKNALAYRRLQQSSGDMPEELYKSFECNLSKNKLEGESGNAVVSVRSLLCEVTDEEIRRLIIENVSPEYREQLTAFADRERLIDSCRRGITSDYAEVKLVSAGREQWFSVNVQLVEDSFSGDIKAYYLFKNIDEQKRGELKVKADMEELRVELENSRIRIMMNQMQPHFLYNALSAIRTCIKVDPDYAYRMIGDFTTHLRSSVKALQNDDPIPFSEEMKNIKAYLNIEKMRMGDRLSFKYDIQCENFKVVPLTIQPLAENAARHGVYPLGDRGGTISVKSYETDTAYVVEVADDGVGFDVEEVFTRQSDSVGLKNLVFRLKKLMNADVNIKSEIGKGTKAIVTLPKTEENKNENDLS